MITEFAAFALMAYWKTGTTFSGIVSSVGNAGITST
jgi:hypothetical protein